MLQPHIRFFCTFAVTRLIKLKNIKAKLRNSATQNSLSELIFMKSIYSETYICVSYSVYDICFNFPGKICDIFNPRENTERHFVHGSFGPIPPTFFYENLLLVEISMLDYCISRVEIPEKMNKPRAVVFCCQNTIT